MSNIHTPIQLEITILPSRDGDYLVSVLRDGENVGDGPFTCKGFQIYTLLPVVIKQTLDAFRFQSDCGQPRCSACKPRRDSEAKSRTQVRRHAR